ncbi:glycosyltransferase family 2 protein [Amylibacter sp.]|nr:glycosyltransferase family 2 protein [Amylibacter sp.]
MYSVLILTKNEEANIERCLRSVSSDDIWILDSLSEDSTLDLCRKFKCNIRTRDFDDYATQRNFGLQFDFKYDWILMLDADECLSERLQEEIISLLDQQERDVGIISLLRRDYFMGRWLHGASGYPVYFPRIFRKDSVRVERAINERYVSDLKNIKSKHHLNHYPFDTGVKHWISKHNYYSSMEVNEASNYTKTRDAYTNYRSRLKYVFYKLPFRPLVMFLYLYFFKLGFLAGRPGFYFCLLRSFYELMINIKRIERNGKL